MDPFRCLEETNWRALLLSALVPWALGCASSETGNHPNTGGSSQVPAGGNSAIGGQGTPSGGLTTGGTPDAVGTGGANAVSGTGSGDAATAGADGSGGSGGRGGTGGGTGTGGATQSSGCGKATTLMNGRASIDVSGMMREYILALPNDYDPSKPYRLIFGWHPWGGSAQQVASGGYYSLVSEAKGQAIFVAPEGLDFNGQGLGWGNTNGQDLAFLSAMLDRFRSQLCIDENRIFSTGFSFGGMFSFAAGCSAMGMMRAIAPMAGNTSVAGCESGGRPVALMGFHGVDDSVVDIDGGRKGRDAFVKRNGCTMETTPAATNYCDGVSQNFQPCACVSYQGCMAGYPVTWCEYKSDHMPAPSSAATLWSFFSQF